MPRVRLTKPTLLLSTLVVMVFLFFTFSNPETPSTLRLVDSKDAAPNGTRPVAGGAITGDAAGHHVPHSHHGKQHPMIPIISQALEYSADGLVHGMDKIHSKLKKSGHRIQDEHHPISELMERGRRRWEDLLRRQSKTLDQAVTEYRKRYGRNPPRGFDKWFHFCKEHGVKIIDDYDQIERDIAPWFGIHPSEVRRRRDQLDEGTHKYKITLRPNGESEMTGDRATSPRPQIQFAHLLPLARYLPEDVTIHVSDHDMGNRIISEELVNAALDAAARGTFVPEEELSRMESKDDPDLGLLVSCADDSTARLLNRPTPDETASAAIEANDNSTSFLFDQKAGMSYCKNPALMKYHGAFTWPQRRGAEMKPMFQMSKLAQNHEFAITPLEAYANATSEKGQREYAPWEEKTINKLFWRGSSTGDSYTLAKPEDRPNYNWRLSHRPRMHLKAQNTEGESRVWVKRQEGWEPEMWSNEALNERYLDVGFAGSARQCDNDGACEEMAKELVPRTPVQPHDAAKYKYALDMDGNGWSSRFHRLLGSGSVVIKSTIYPEWNSDWVTPWVHYIPSKMDYSDLYDIMSYFSGSPDDPNSGHDQLARQIGLNARKFTLEHWRWEDMQAYMLRLLLEYQRLMSEDRTAATYKAPKKHPRRGGHAPPSPSAQN